MVAAGAVLSIRHGYQVGLLPLSQKTVIARRNFRHLHLVRVLLETAEMGAGRNRSRWVAAMALAAIGCVTSSDRASSEDQAGEDPNSPDELRCTADIDCEPASSSCCQCPSFALSAAQGFGEACGGVDCQGFEEASCSQMAEAVCNDGQCELRCAVVAVAPEAFCDSGYVRDELGCLTVECASPDGGVASCTDDAECVQVPADCCGCANGGADTAVNEAREQEHRDSLGCSSSPGCPGVNVCDGSVIPRCLAGQCQLAPADADLTETGEGQLCGTSSLPACPAGQVCELNAPGANDADRFGVGVCRPE